VQALNCMKEYHEEEVLAFVDRFDTSRDECALLAAALTAKVEKERLLSRSPPVLPFTDDGRNS
jgi:hypothetical protein